MDWIRVVVLLLLGSIVVSLGNGLYHLGSGRGDPGKLLRALTIRITLSVILFVLLMLAWRGGLISPRGG